MNNYRPAYIIVGILAALVLIAVAIPFTFNIFNTGSGTTAVEQKVVQENTQKLSDFREGSTQEAQQAYVQSADTSLLDPSLTPDARDLILLRKAVVLMTTRGDLKTNAANQAQAIQIFKKLINSDNQSSKGLYYRDFAIVGLVKTNLQCCVVTPSIIDETPIFSTYAHYRSIGLSDALSAMLTLDDASAQLTTARKADIMNRVNSMDIATKILVNYGDEINADIKARLLKELGFAISEFPTLKPLTFTDDSTAKYEAAFKLARAYDVFKSNQSDGKTAAANKAIDKQYDDAIAALKAAMSEPGDSHGLNEILFYTSIGYEESLDRRYGESVDTAKRDAVIADILRVIETDPAVSQTATIYFTGIRNLQHSNPSEAKKFNAVIHFMDLAKTHPDVAAYMKNIGLGE